MPLLSRGLRVAAGETQILLNNRVFENASGSAFVTIKPDAPPKSTSTQDIQVALLDPGTNGSSAAGYLRISIRHLEVNGANNTFAFVIEPLGTAANSAIVSVPINYTDETTLGLTWDANTGTIFYAIANADKILVAPTQATGVNAFTGGVSPVLSGLGLNSTVDTPQAINDGKYNGFIGKITTYSNTFTDTSLNAAVLNPETLPTTNRLLLLDATNLAGVERVDASVGELQQITFGSALRSGAITVGGVTTVIVAGDSGATIAEKVRASLADNNLFKQQLEKQKITFSGTAASTSSTSLKVAGVSIPLVSGNDASAVATAVKKALDENSWITANAGRSVQNNGDGSLTITFNATDGDARPIAVDSGISTIKASVDTVQTYSATGNGRKVSASGATLSIALNPADLNAKDLAVSVGGTGVNITNVTTTSEHLLESASFVPSQTSFAGTPVGEIQRIQITTGADAAGSIAVGGGAALSSAISFAKSGGYTPAETASAIATAIKAANLANVSDAFASGDTVEVQFKASAGDVSAITLTDTTGSETNLAGRIFTSRQFAQNLQGEAQTITFTAPTAAGNISVDGVLVPILSTDTAATVASKVLSGLVADAGQEVQSLTLSGATTTAGNITVNGVAVPLSTTENSASLIAAKVVSTLNSQTGLGYVTSQVGSTGEVRFTFHASGNQTALSGFATPGSNAAAGATGSSLATLREGSAPGSYSQPEVQTITFLSGTSLTTGTGTISVNGQTVTLSGGASGAGDDTASEVAAKVATALNAVTTRNYIAAQDGDSVRVTFYNGVGDTALLSGLTLPSSGGATGVTATNFSTLQEYNANGRRVTKVNADGSLTIEFAPNEGNVAPILFTDTGATGVTASVATTREANAVKVTSSSYTGNVTVPVDTTLPGSNVIYTQLVSTDSGVAGKTTKKLVFDVYIDPTVKTNTKVGTGYETVDFTMGYSTNDFAPGSVNVVLTKSAGGSPIVNTTKAGQIVVRWLDTSSVIDFTKPIARITMDQLPASGVFRDNVDFTFSNVNIDGVDYSDGTTFARTFTDTINTDRWDIRQKLVNGLDSTTAISGQMVAYFGSTSESGRTLELKVKDLKDPAGASPTLTNPSKVLTMDVVNAEVAGLRKVKFAVELPSNVDVSGTGAAAATKFTLSPEATAAGLKLSTAAGDVNAVVGRTLLVSLDWTQPTNNTITGLAKGASLGTIETKADNSRDITHEFSFAPSSIKYSTSTATNALGSGKSLYVGYTATSSDSLSKGDWMARDMPRGEFNKVFFDTAPTNAAKVVTAADALQILKLSAYFDLDWKPGAAPVGAFAAADLDGSGKVTSADALIALRYATGIVPTPDPVKWKFYDSATTGLVVENTTLQALKTGMPVTGSNDILEITGANGQKDFFTQAILVGNLTNPALEV